MQRIALVSGIMIMAVVVVIIVVRRRHRSMEYVAMPIVRRKMMHRHSPSDIPRCRANNSLATIVTATIVLIFFVILSREPIVKYSRMPLRQRHTIRRQRLIAGQQHNLNGIVVHRGHFAPFVDQMQYRHGQAVDYDGEEHQPVDHWYHGVGQRVYLSVAVSRVWEELSCIFNRAYGADA
jgi:hypothetical protein